VPDYLNMHRKPTIAYGQQRPAQQFPLAPRQAPAQTAVKAFTLRELEARLEKVVSVPTTEIETEEGDCKGLYVWRDSTGEAYKWGPTPISYEFHDVGSIAEADLIMFLCPLCYAKNGGAKNTHSVMVSFAGRSYPDEAGSRDADGKPSRWSITSGTTLDDLTLSPSILLDAKQPADQGCHWHGFVGMAGIPPGHAG
jgi:hypothetical protein